MQGKGKKPEERYEYDIKGKRGRQWQSEREVVQLLLAW